VPSGLSWTFTESVCVVGAPVMFASFATTKPESYGPMPSCLMSTLPPLIAPVLACVAYAMSPSATSAPMSVLLKAMCLSWAVFAAKGG